MGALVRAARAGLAELGDPEKATEMRRYMKSEMPFRGVPKPERAGLARRLFAAHPLPDAGTWAATIRTLWRTAEFREERYLAIDLSGHRAYAGWQGTGMLPVYEEMIVTGAWWDFVDEVAIRRVGPLLRAAPETLTPMLRGWAVDEDLWRRRTAVICQIGAKDKTDTELLTDTIESTVSTPDGLDFFIRKGIGWALRDYSKTDPDWVRAFVTAHPALSPLSVREALRRLPARTD